MTCRVLEGRLPHRIAFCVGPHELFVMRNRCGVELRIVALRAGRGLDLRLTELGLNVGSELSVVQRQGGGLLVARGETRIAIGGGMATKVLVVRA